ncbi:MAG: hypothetical protein GQ537_09325, partial [Gammaproteobacteria bacterium]|nr:hypothetical protein [Gammaproteobacteria bacterium]
MKIIPIKLTVLASSILLASLAGSTAFADDGELVRKKMTPSQGTAPPVPAGHIAEADHAFIDMMKFYVPSQEANGEVSTDKATQYINIDGELVETHLTAKPLVSVYIYGPSEGFDDVGFVGHGTREAYGAVSLDDGQTWKASNLSESADQVSSDVCRDDISLYGEDVDCETSEGNYPGDVVNVFQATAGTNTGLADSAGTNTLAVWPSRFCSAGEPNYSLDSSNPERRLAIAAWMGIDIGTDGTTQANPSPDDLYLIDMFGVGGSQGSVDYSEDKFEQNQKVGEVPYSCLWAARGKLVMGDDPRTDATEASYMRWFKAERLTSGARDVNRVETKCVVGAGCAVTWQEDPEGLRGGQGLGPGVGWSGAVAHSQTDTWYAYLNWEHFDLVQDPEDNGVTILTFQEYLDSEDASKPQAGIPFSIPMRVTDNAKCNVTNPKPYCNGSAIFADNDDVLNPLDYGMVDMCADTVELLTGSGQPTAVCITEYGMPLVGNIASTRPRLGLYGYDSDRDDHADSAFVVFESEESKGLGAFGFSDGTPCDPEEDEGCIAFDEGKNLWYYTFNMEL